MKPSTDDSKREPGEEQEFKDIVPSEEEEEDDDDDNQDTSSEPAIINTYKAKSGFFHVREGNEQQKKTNTSRKSIDTIQNRVSSNPASSGTNTNTTSRPVLGRMSLSFSSKAYSSTRKSSKGIPKDNLTNNVSIEHEVSINDTVRSIVDCEILWSEMQETIRASGAVTSLAVNEVCRAYIQDRQERIRKERREEQKRQESNQNTFTKIAKRLSMFG
jgi:hypothetical protein